ncbi:TetR/AcrR family transcriptional regulator [Microbacterium luticocti]|uniref:TetR/AcrR family transcriptional regulator n=1 Tax=Microbacterium luticocti TaxID=451764 RepID=UPI000405BBBE|nr:TetR/AcrR family transcriptional regulator [Microbacterium luticocti]
MTDAARPLSGGTARRRATGQRRAAAATDATARTREPDATGSVREPDATTRTRILDAAADLFATHGFDGTSTARIAHAAAVPKGLLFYYFPTKPDLLSTLLEERLGTADLDPASLTAPDDPTQTLVNIGDRVLREHEASDVLREIIWHESHTRPEVRVALTRYRHALHDTIARALNASLPAPVDGDAVRAAAAAWAATITARPLEASGDTARLHGATSLGAIARLLVAGLLATGLRRAESTPPGPRQAEPRPTEPPQTGPTSTDPRPTEPRQADRA